MLVSSRSAADFSSGCVDYRIGYLKALYREKLKAGSSVRYIHTTLHKALKQTV
jgi:hypothetical protein